MRAPQQAAPAPRSLRAPSAYIAGRQRFQNGSMAGSSSDALHQVYSSASPACSFHTDGSLWSVELVTLCRAMTRS